MGRGVQTEPPVDVGFIRQSFTVGDGGELQRRVAVTNSAEDPVYDNGGGALRVRLTFGGKRRTMDAAKLAWILHEGSHPRGQVETIAAPNDFRRSNLTIVPHCSHRPGVKGSPATSLVRRQAADADLLLVMSQHPNASVEELGELTNISRARASTRLTKLSELGLTVGPQCVPGRSWMLTHQGRTVAMEGKPLIDDLDRDILAVLRLAAMGPVRLGRRINVCELTVRRRAKLLEAKGLLLRDPRRFYELTLKGREALGESAPPPRWIDTTRISAAASREVIERGGSGSVDDRTSKQKSAHLPGAKLVLLQGHKTKLGRPPSAWSEARLTRVRASPAG